MDILPDGTVITDEDDRQRLALPMGSPVSGEYRLGFIEERITIALGYAARNTERLLPFVELSDPSEPSGAVQQLIGLDAEKEALEAMQAQIAAHKAGVATPVVA